MELQLTVVSLQSSHFDDWCFFQVIEPKFFAFEIWHDLHHSGQRINQVDQIVAFVVNDVNIGTGVLESSLETRFDDVLHQLRVGLIAYFENVVFGDGSKTGSCGL